MTVLKYEKEILALLVIDPHNDFTIHQRGMDFCKLRYFY